MARMGKNDLTAMEREFVKHYEGNQSEAAKLAGYKQPWNSGNQLMSRKRVKDAIAKKQLLVTEVTKETIRQGVKITRNDIINRLDKISTSAESEGARVQALRVLTDIFGLSVKNGKDTDLFAGWTDEELNAYRATGALPARIRSAVGAIAGDAGDSGSSVSSDSRTT